MFSTANKIRVYKIFLSGYLLPFADFVARRGLLASEDLFYLAQYDVSLVNRQTIPFYDFRIS